MCVCVCVCVCVCEALICFERLLLEKIETLVPLLDKSVGFSIDSLIIITNLAVRRISIDIAIAARLLVLENLDGVLKVWGMLVLLVADLVVVISFLRFRFASSSHHPLVSVEHRRIPIARHVGGDAARTPYQSRYVVIVIVGRHVCLEL